jgi:hypothetical protein
VREGFCLSTEYGSLLRHAKALLLNETAGDQAPIQKSGRPSDLLQTFECCA